MSEFTPKYNLEKPSQDDFYDVDVHNKNMERIEEQLSLNEEAVKNMDVSASITNVINERVNADTSKPLSTLISEWINTAKTAILDAVSTLTTHVTSQHTTTKNHVTTKVDALPQKSVWTDARGAKLDNLNQSMTTTQTNITSAVNSARDNVKSHVTSVMGAPKVVKSVQRGVLSCDAANLTIPISSVNPAKCSVSLYGFSDYSSSSGMRVPIVTSLTATSLSLQTVMFSNNWTTSISWEIIEFY